MSHNPVKDFDPATYEYVRNEQIEVQSPLVEKFAAKVGQTVTLNGELPLKLLKAQPSVRFSVAPGETAPTDIPVGVHLILEGPDANTLPEGCYHLDVDGEGLHIHLIPIHCDPSGPQLYQTVTCE